MAAFEKKYQVGSIPSICLTTAQWIAWFMATINVLQDQRWAKAMRKARRAECASAAASTGQSVNCDLSSLNYTAVSLFWAISSIKFWSNKIRKAIYICCDTVIASERRIRSSSASTPEKPSPFHLSPAFQHSNMKHESSFDINAHSICSETIWFPATFHYFHLIDFL